MDPSCHTSEDDDADDADDDDATGDSRLHVTTPKMVVWAKRVSPSLS